VTKNKSHEREKKEHLINALFGVGSAYACGPGSFSGTNGVATGVNILRVNNLSLAKPSGEIKTRG